MAEYRIVSDVSLAVENCTLFDNRKQHASVSVFGRMASRGEQDAQYAKIFATL